MASVLSTAPRFASPVVVAALVDSLGSGAYLGLSIVMLTRYVGLPALTAAGFLSAAGVVAFLLLVPLGLLAERIGARTMLVTLHATRAGAYALMLLRPPAALVLVLLCVVTAGERSAIPMLQTLAAEQNESDRVKTMARVRVMQNTGMSIGAGLAALALTVRSTTGLVAVVLWNILSYLGAGALLLRGPRRTPTPPPASPAARTPRFVMLRDGRFAAATVLCAVLGLHAPVLTFAVPLWVTSRTSLPSGVLPALVLCNTVSVVLLQVRLSKGTDETRGAGRALSQSGLLLALTALLMACTLAVPGGWNAAAVLVAAILAQAGAEMRQQAGAWGLSYALSPIEHRARYLSFFSLGSVARNAVAPILLTAVIAAPGAWGWLVLALGMAVTSLLAILLTAQWTR
ncbi:MFS transporter [Streptomyces sp. NPDC127038]|uniref:MFS transporter n=1 Tax=Streptomyces sp. NPDC127038 TaxID=3347114 RepID=UPI003661DA4F